MWWRRKKDVPEKYVPSVSDDGMDYFVTVVLVIVVLAVLGVLWMASEIWKSV